MTHEELVEWVRKSCEEQGVPVKVTNPLVVQQVCTLLRAGRTDDHGKR